MFMNRELMLKLKYCDVIPSLPDYLYGLDLHIFFRKERY